MQYVQFVIVTEQERQGELHATHLEMLLTVWDIIPVEHYITQVELRRE